MSALTYEEAVEVYEILEDYAGAPGADENSYICPQFIDYAQCNPNDYPLEYRFQGELGFGGKWHFDGRRMYVSCYPEDETPFRRQVVATTNEELEEWWLAKREVA